MTARLSSRSAGGFAHKGKPDAEQPIVSDADVDYDRKRLARTGHELSGDMISRYDRGATTLEDLAYGPFPDISRAMPQLAALHTRLHISRASDGGGQTESEAVSITSIVGARGFEPPTPRSRTDLGTTEEAQGRGNVTTQSSAQVPSGPLEGQVGNEWGNADRVEGALASALTAAANAGRFDVVAQLARELEARRVTRMGNVVSLARMR